jgi:hypothetical protein
MKTSTLDCLRDAARSLLGPHQVSRIALLGATPLHGLPFDDLHLLVEFAAGAQPIALNDWLRIQRLIGEQCHLRVELVSVSRLEEHVAADMVALTVLFDAAARG